MKAMIGRPDKARSGLPATALALTFSCLSFCAAEAAIEITGSAKTPAPGTTKADPSSPPKAAVAPKDKSMAPAPAPSLSVGDRWEFTRTADLKSERVGNAYRYSVAAVTTAEYTMDIGYKLSHALASLNFVEGGKVTQIFRPAAFSLRFPLTVGKRWSESWEIRKPDGDLTGLVTSEGRVTAIEKISVPAGGFETYRVAYTFRTKLSDGSVETGSRTVWYAPSAKCFVRLEYEVSRASGTPYFGFTNELKSYSVATQ